MTSLSIVPSATTSQVVRLDVFTVPEATRAPFEAAMRRNIGFIATLPGYRGHVVLEKLAGPSRFEIATLAVWDDEAAIAAAVVEVRAFYARTGFDMASSLAAWGVEGELGSYRIAGPDQP